MKMIFMVLVLLGINSFALPNQPSQPGRGPIPKPPSEGVGADTRTLYCRAGGQSSIHMGLKVSNGTMTNGPVQYRFRKAGYPVTNTNGQFNLNKGDCGFFGGVMANMKDYPNSFFDNNVIGKDFEMGVDNVFENPTAVGGVAPSTYTQTFAVPGYQEIEAGVLFKVGIRLTNGTIEVENGQAPVLIP